MRGILYFSSTGNSLYLAKRIREKLPGRILYLPDYTGDGSEFEEIVLVSPVYSFGLPVHTYDFFLRMTPAAQVTVVLSYGGMTGGAERLVCEFARQYGKRLQAVYTVAMPENYTLTFSTPGFYNRLVLRRAEKKIDRLIASMQRGEVHLPAAGKTRRALYEKNKANWHLIARDFSATEACVQCGKCVRLCPVQNISLENGRICFADRCVACLGCYHRCPQKAIVYKNRKKKDRYLNPNIRESEIGQNL